MVVGAGHVLDVAVEGILLHCMLAWVNSLQGIDPEHGVCSPEVIILWKGQQRV